MHFIRLSDELVVNVDHISLVLNTADHEGNKFVEVLFYSGVTRTFFKDDVRQVAIYNCIVDKVVPFLIKRSTIE